MPYFGDQSDGTLHVTSGTHNLQLNRKYQFRSVKVDAGATLSTNSSTGAVLYILAHESIEINGTIDVSNKVNHGDSTWAVTIDGVRYTSPGVANGAYYTSHGSNNRGFGSGGGSSGANLGGGVTASGGSGGSGGSGISGGGSRSTGNRTSNGSTTRNGFNGSNSGGAGGAAINRVFGMDVYHSGSVGATGGAGGNSYGANGANGASHVTISGGSYDPANAGAGAIGTGGGGAGGRAGRAGVRVILKAPRVILNGQVITRGTNGGNGGNGGRNSVNGSWENYWGFPGLGGGGGRGGRVEVYYGTELSFTGNFDDHIQQQGGSGGISGRGGSGNVRSSAVGGTGGHDGWSYSQLLPHEYPSDIPDLGGIAPTSAIGTLTITTQALDIEAVGGIAPTSALGSVKIGRNVAQLGAIASGAAMGDTLGIEQSPPPPPPPTDWEAIGKEDEKVYIYKVYSSEGDFIGVWDDVIDDLQYTQHINTPGTTTTVQLGRSPNTTKEARSGWITQDGEQIVAQDGQPLMVTYETNNNVGEDTDVDLNYNVDIYVHYGEFEEWITQDGEQIVAQDGEDLLVTSGAPMGVRVFSGFILDYESVYGEETGVTVTLASHGYELSHEIIRNGEVTTVDYSTTEVSEITRDILDTNPGRMTYSGESILPTGTNITTRFQLNTKLEGIRSAFGQTPSDWYWFGNPADNYVYLRPRSATPQHIFLKGKHVKSLRLKRSLEGLVNLVYFVGGEVVEGNPATTLYKKYERPVSQAQWRVGLERITDRRFTIEASAANRATKLMDLREQPVFTTPLTISSARYDLESIKLGHVVGFGNFGNLVDDVLLQVVALTYTPTAVTMELGAFLDRQVDTIAEIDGSLQNEQYQNLPNAPS